MWKPARSPGVVRGRDPLPGRDRTYRRTVDTNPNAIGACPHPGSTARSHDARAYLGIHAPEMVGSAVFRRKDRVDVAGRTRDGGLRGRSPVGLQLRGRHRDSGDSVLARAEDGRCGRLYIGCGCLLTVAVRYRFVDPVRRPSAGHRRACGGSQTVSIRHGCTHGGAPGARLMAPLRTAVA